MKIRELSIKNCLSFCEKGLNKNNSIELGDFNLFIGSNNAGKSNVLKLMEFLKNVLTSIRERGNHELLDIAVSSAGMPIDWLFAQDQTRKMNFSFSLQIDQADGIIKKYEHRKEKNPVWFMFEHKNDWPKLFKITGIIEYKNGQPHVTITKVEIPNDHKAYNKEPILFDRENKKILALRPSPFGDEQVWKVLDLLGDERQWNSDYSAVGNTILRFLHELYDEIFTDLLINIRAIREIEPLGDDRVESLSYLRDGAPKDKKLHDSVVNYIKTLIFAGESQEISFVYPGKSGERQLKIQIGELQLPLSHYGSAVEQMLVLAAEIVRHGSNKVVLIEEPEAHFYPYLQRKFIRFLKDNQKQFKHQYLIATHSSTFIDEFINMNGNVFHVHCEQDDETKPKYSQVEPFDKDKSPLLFKALGIRPSDLLLANGILVVEGITDKDVYTDWARKIEKPFEKISLEVIDVEGAGNISKYLGSDVIQQTCFKNYGLCDKNAENELREKLKGIVPDENIIALKKGDLEDYYPRELVLEFAREFAPKKGKTPDKIPDEIKEGETVKKLSELLNGDWWKRNLAEKVITEMTPDQIDEEIKDRLTEIYESVY
jgi:energy-coupling factor transporter ATP-binding protein EcfA2